MLSEALESFRFIFQQGHEHGIAAGGGEATSAVCPNQLHEALAAVSAAQQVIFSNCVLCPVVMRYWIAQSNLVAVFES